MWLEKLILSSFIAQSDTNGSQNIYVVKMKIMNWVLENVQKNQRSAEILKIQGKIAFAIKCLWIVFYWNDTFEVVSYIAAVDSSHF